MKIRMIAPIRNFDTDLEEIVLTKNLKIIKGSLLNSKIQLSRKFKEQVGSVNWDLITSNYIFHFLGEASELVELRSGDRLTVLKTISGKIGDFFHDFIDGLWFIKDNCCFCNQFFLELITEQKVSITYKNIIAGTATDEFSYIKFNAEEIARHKEIYFELKKFQIASDTKKQDLINQIFSTEGGIIPSPTNMVSYDHPRLYRAIFFLSMVRRHGSAITKITFFIMMYECLFTSDDQAIAKKIRERASAFLGGSTKSKKAFKDLVFRAYDIRSRNVHGDIVDTPQDKMKTIVASLDLHTREILNQIIGMENKDIFIQQDSVKTRQNFEHYFDSLVSQSAKQDLSEVTQVLLKPCVMRLVLPRYLEIKKNNTSNQ
jgi:hypothetical protein